MKTKLIVGLGIAVAIGGYFLYQNDPTRKKINAVMKYYGFDENQAKQLIAKNPNLEIPTE